MNLLQRLTSAAATHHDSGEARAIAMAILEDVVGMSRTDIYMSRFPAIDEATEAQLSGIAERLCAGEPMQYAVGFANFGGRRFVVTEDTLIPRPETEQLVALSADYVRDSHLSAPRILDAGTGTGCIAVSLACDLPEAEVTAWDISPRALEVAAQNAAHHDVKVRFVHQDILAYDKIGAEELALAGRKFDLIVSNPPYICDRERCDMAAHVLDHEPGTALFVPDDDPLRFYHALLGWAQKILAPAGAVMMECNTAYVRDVAHVFATAGFATACHDDCFGRPRFVVAQS